MKLLRATLLRRCAHFGGGLFWAIGLLAKFILYDLPSAIALGLLLSALAGTGVFTLLAAYSARELTRSWRDRASLLGAEIPADVVRRSLPLLPASKEQSSSFAIKLTVVLWLLAALPLALMAIGTLLEGKIVAALGLCLASLGSLAQAGAARLNSTLDLRIAGMARTWEDEIRQLGQVPSRAIEIDGKSGAIIDKESR